MITLPEPLLDNAKRFAAERGITLSALIEDALRCRLSLKPPIMRAGFACTRTAEGLSIRLWT